MLWLVLLVLAVAAASLAYPLVRRAPVTQSLVLANLGLFLVVFVLRLLQPDLASLVALDAQLREELYLQPQDLGTLQTYTLVTAMFLHLNFFHILGNVVILYLLGLPLEDRIGGPAFAAIYMITGIAASVVFAGIRWGQDTAGLGASGAIMGLAGAFLALYPREKIFFLLGPIIVPETPVYVAAGVVIAFQVVLLLLGVPGVAISAHFGGMLAGILVARPLVGERRREPGPATLAGLEDLATTKELRDLLATIQGETVPEVRDAWVDHFLRKARCPRCGGSLTRDGGRVTSPCGWETRL